MPGQKLTTAKRTEQRTGGERKEEGKRVGRKGRREDERKGRTNGREGEGNEKERGNRKEQTVMSYHDVMIMPQIAFYHHHGKNR